MKTQQGFTLTEVMVSLVISVVALLGLGKAQLQSLKHANNGFYYTQASIHAQNVSERLWLKACEFQQNPAAFTNAAYRASLQPGSRFNLVLPDAFANQMAVEVNWQDSRIEDGNSVSLNLTFPEFCQ
ncbi:prepilin-type N-terminal cleavage/methylation domain-containing protein [Shewanella sp. 3B26]|jgi:type IV pilus assembly protein PilV|uniref:Prepilin-type N-terminal cleavage/methylation domain-containing protein n=1 Tax=Shewanella zhuhaiensis TaxID=2919576 RepID=A0AAJ1F0Q1_9GAMM|nr:prepilin-type N-terminal cleavage/methylation domain-containing protein [Shewanella zhuhaiensis]MCH4294603.1 prepilin-type N-terminal cleavage/methylation domain-containing protein [Shewanella zhuhaiensis]